MQEVKTAPEEQMLQDSLARDTNTILPSDETESRESLPVITEENSVTSDEVLDDDDISKSDSNAEVINSTFGKVLNDETKNEEVIATNDDNTTDLNNEKDSNEVIAANDDTNDFNNEDSKKDSNEEVIAANDDTKVISNEEATSNDLNNEDSKMDANGEVIATNDGTNDDDSKKESNEEVIATNDDTNETKVISNEEGTSNNDDSKMDSSDKIANNDTEACKKDSNEETTSNELLNDTGSSNEEVTNPASDNEAGKKEETSSIELLLDNGTTEVTNPAFDEALNDSKNEEVTNPTSNEVFNSDDTEAVKKDFNEETSSSELLDDDTNQVTSPTANDDTKNEEVTESQSETSLNINSPVIEELESSPLIPKRVTSSPHDTSLTVATSVVSAESTVPTSPPISKAAQQLESVINSSSEGMTSEDKVGASNTKSWSKPRSASVFYDKSPSPQGSKPPSKKEKGAKSIIRKNKKQLSMIEPTPVSLAAPQSTIDWDPTCILEELYTDCHPCTTHSSTGESVRHSGYLDKLPVNQRKPTVVKGWKHRFFRLTRGSLFYYDYANSTKATSFIRLSDSKIVVHPESLKIEIIEKGSGNFIMLRADSKEDVATWQRVLQLEAVHPTMTHRPSLSPSRSDTVVILDLGSCSVRAGLVSDNTYPQMFFPNVCAFSDNKIIACGNNSLLPGTRRQVKMVYPCRHRTRLDSSIPARDCYQFIIETVCKCLQIEPHSASILVCVSPIMSEAEKINLVEVILEVLGFKNVLLQEQTTMALYSYNNTSGIVVSIGDSTNVVPIIDGFKIDSGTSYTPFGGQSVSENLSKLATAKDIRYFSEAEMYIIRYIKENICFLSQDYPEDSIKCENSPAEYIRAVDVDRFQLPNHKKVIHLDSALFKATEGLFTPGLWGRDVVGIQDMVKKAIEQCPMDMRRQMTRSIYLAGGTTLLIGFQERLQKEMELLFPRMDVQIHASDNRQHAAFLGAGVLASLNSFVKSLVDIDTWHSKGLEAMKSS